MIWRATHFLVVVPLINRSGCDGDVMVKLKDSLDANIDMSSKWHGKDRLSS